MTLSLPWVKLATNYYLDAVIARESDAVEVMFTRGIAYCGSAATAGFIPDAVLPHLGRARHKSSANALVRAGKWLRDDTRGGYVVNRWADYQDDAEQLIERRRRDRDRKRDVRRNVRGQSAGTSADIPGDFRAGEVEEERTPLTPRKAGGCKRHPARPKPGCEACQPTVVPIRADESCPTHPGQPAVNCGGCRSEALAGGVS